MSIFRSSKIYVRLSPTRISARNLDSGKEAVDATTTAFQHPRSLVADFLEAARSIQKLVKEVNGSPLLRPFLLMHWEPKLEGGLSLIEARVLTELAQSSGARASKVFQTNDPLPADWEAQQKKLMG